MRLVALRLQGYRRFEAQSTLDLTPRVVAVVGPNEAGKSTILRALEHATWNGRKPFTQSDFSGRVPPDENREVLSVLFALDEDDRVALVGIPGAESVRLFRRFYRANGEVITEVVPALARPLETRSALAALIERLLARNPRRLRELLDREAGDLALTVPDDEEGPDAADDTASREPVSLRFALSEILEELREDTETLDGHQRSRIRAVARVVGEEGGVPAYVRNLAALCTTLADEHDEDHPNDRVQTVLRQRRPAVRVLRESDRQLQPSYAFDDHDSAPDPLENLLQLAGVTWDELRTVASEPDNPVLATLIKRANRRLRRYLHGSWRQAQVSIELREQQGVLNVFPYDEASETHSRIEDRSEGFRSFLALLAFTARHSEGGRRLILAIDEAELHLHYDAQADLVRVLTQQRLVPQIIYTTHSAGCLPDDLGSAIRVVRTIDGDRSVVDNAFWSSNSAGFTPLLMAMGAGAVAFTPARSAVITEGPSDALLLPALLRAAMGFDLDHSLGLQVVGGLAWTPPREVASLEAEAARVVYLADGDADGRRYMARLLEARVPDARIFVLGRKGSGLTIEDFVHKTTYVEVVNELLVRLRGYSGSPLRLKDVPDAGAAKAVDAWMRRKRVEPLSKTAIAENLLRVTRASLAYMHWTDEVPEARRLLRRDRARQLQALYGSLDVPLGLRVAEAKADAA